MTEMEVLMRLARGFAKGNRGDQLKIEFPCEKRNAQACLLEHVGGVCMRYACCCMLLQGFPDVCCNPWAAVDRRGNQPMCEPKGPEQLSEKSVVVISRPTSLRWGGVAIASCIAFWTAGNFDEARDRWVVRLWAV